jgi:NAD(P)-dependent dehydrogenase (short-subunit alcohol dehydrogenase family)
VNVSGSRILLVGGVRRLGRALALDLAGAGASVCVTSRQAGVEVDAQVAALRAAGAPQATAVTGDVSAAAQAGQLVADGAAALGGLDALIFAASGPFIPTPPHEIDEASWDGSLDTIAKGFFFTACAARAQFLAGAREGAAGDAPAAPEAVTAGGAHATRGVIVALTDYLGLQPWAAFAAHGAAKAAQIHLVKELAKAWSPDGVRVCGVAPGPVDLEDDEHRAATLRAAAKVASERLVLPADVGAAVRFCLETDGVTGVNVVVDNGSLVMS